VIFAPRGPGLRFNFMNMLANCFPRAALRGALCMVVAVLWSGCGAKKSEPDAPPAKSSGVAASPSTAPVVDLAPFAGAMPAASGPGEVAWIELISSVQMPEMPASWETNPPSRAEVTAFQLKQGEAAGAVATKLREFYTKFPASEHAEEAREQEFDLLNAAAKAGVTNALARLEALEAARLTNTALPEEARLQVRFEQMERAAGAAEAAEDFAGAAKAREAAGRALLKEYPNRGELAGLLLMAAQNYLKAGQTDQARTLAMEVTKNESPELKELATGFVQKLDRVGQPLALKFTALDGREVDLEKLRGKVVLVDFWATWCLPCLSEMPKVKALYEKLHDQGFEIVGVSLDEKKGDLERYLTKEKIPWPQYFEGASENRLAKEFQIDSIPTMWLVDRQGRLRELNARKDLAPMVEKLLAEKP
jgi:thiol-disulfide isomerase/thioredoxin